LKRPDAFCILLTSVGLVLAFPPLPLGSIAVVVLVPIFFFIRSKGIWEAFRGGYLAGLLWAGGTLYWIGRATIPGCVGAILFLPLYTALFTALQAWLWNRWGDVSFLVAPFTWTGIELLSSFGALAFPWNVLAYTQTYAPVLIQYASITGVYGVSFWIVAMNVLFYFVLRRGGDWKRSYGLILSIAILFILPYIHGRRELKQTEESQKKIKVALIQGNIDPYKKWTPSFVDSNFVIYERLTTQASREHPDLIIWPETAAPCYLRHRFSCLHRVRSLIDSLGIPLLTGAPDYEWLDRNTIEKYNGAFVILPQSWNMDYYYKMNLVPFSERVPLADRLPFLYDLSTKVDSNVGDFSPGDSIRVFTLTPSSSTEPVHFSTVICYESIFPYLVRDCVRKGAQFVVIITNDGWFGKSGPYQHARIAIFRSIENRVWIARCANTGISEVIDPFGRIRSKTALDREAILTADVALQTKKTFFVKHAFMFPGFVLGVNGLVFLATVVLKRRIRIPPRDSH